MKEKEEFFEAKNVTFYDMDDKPIIFIDSIGSKQLVLNEHEYKQITIHKLVNTFSNCKKDKELKELDFSNISDENWLKLKNVKIKKIILDVPID